MARRFRWKRKGRMMSRNQFYSSPLHFATEKSYTEYKKDYKKRRRE